MDEMTENQEVVEEVEAVEEEVSLADALAAEFERQSDEPQEPVSDASSEDVTETEIQPPEHWSAEDKQAFMSMDESGRDWALRLEANAHKGIEEKSIQLKKFRDAFEPYKHLVPAGVDETQVIQGLLNAQAVLERSPLEGIKWLMRSYGVDEKQLLPTDTVPDDDEFIDPEVKALKEKVSQLTDQAERSLLAQQQHRQQQIFAEIIQFRDAVNEQGESAHPHFGAVQGVMSGLLQSGRAEDLQSAYEQAVWAVPEYRDSVIEQQARERAEKELAEKTQTAQKAKKSATAVNGKSSAKKISEPKTMAEALSEAYEKSIRGEL